MELACFMKDWIIFNDPNYLILRKDHAAVAADIFYCPLRQTSLPAFKQKPPAYFAEAFCPLLA